MDAVSYTAWFDKKLTLEKREFFYRVPEIGIRNQTTELRREGVRKQVKNGSKGNRRNDKPKLLRFTDQPLDPVEDHLRFYAPDTAVIAIFTGFLSIYGARSASEIGLQDTFLSGTRNPESRARDGSLPTPTRWA